MSEFEQPVNIVPETIERFEADDPKLKDFLDTHGFVVVKGVIDTIDIETAKIMLWKYLDDNADMKCLDSTTWTSENLSKIGLPETGILCDGNFGQSDFMWYVRLMPKLKLAFSTVHNTDELIGSMDGGNIFLPWSNNVSLKTETGWYHVDQGSTMRGFQCVQGLVTLTDVTPATGGLCLIPGSAAHHDELLDLTHEQYNFVEVPSSFHALSHTQILPLCNAGDLILWDSRTMHCSTPALETPIPSTIKPDQNELLRIAAYVCMTPRKWATKEVLQNRADAYMRDMSLHHWPHIITHEISEDRPVVRQYCNAPPQVQQMVGLL